MERNILHPWMCRKRSMAMLSRRRCTSQHLASIVPPWLLMPIWWLLQGPETDLSPARTPMGENDDEEGYSEDEDGIRRTPLSQGRYEVLLLQKHGWFVLQFHPLIFPTWCHFLLASIASIQGPFPTFIICLGRQSDLLTLIFGAGINACRPHFSGCFQHGCGLLRHFMHANLIDCIMFAFSCIWLSLLSSVQTKLMMSAFASMMFHPYVQSKLKLTN